MARKSSIIIDDYNFSLQIYTDSISLVERTLREGKGIIIVIVPIFQRIHYPNLELSPDILLLAKGHINLAINMIRV